MDLEALADRSAIETLLIRYASGLDARDWDSVRSVFASDAVLDYTSFDGPRGAVDEVVDWIAAALAPFDVCQHFVTNLVVTLDGDEARAHCYLFNPMGRRSDSGEEMHFFTVGGAYHDVLRRGADGWQIVERVAEARWFDGV